MERVILQNIELPFFYPFSQNSRLVNMKVIFGIFFTLFSIILTAQDLYIKSAHATNSQIYLMQIETLSDGSYVIAGADRPSSDSSTIFLRKFNPCGEEIWSKLIADSTKPLYLVELNIDSSQNIIITARKSVFNQNPFPILLKFNPNGNLIYSKIFNSIIGYNSLIYSSSIAPNGDYYVAGVHRYNPSPPNNSNYFVARVNPNGNLIWVKNLNVSSMTYARMLATRDGGVVLYFSNKIIKLDNLGVKEWAKNYNYLGSLITPIETDSGFVFARYFTGGLDRGNVFSIRKNGSVGWVTNSFFDFFPFRGVTRNNGNVLFPGIDPLNSNSTVFLELDFKDGTIVKSSKVQNSIGYFPTDISETSKNELYFVGPDNRGVLPQLIMGKMNDTLSTLSCTSGIINPPTDPFNIVELSDNPLTTFSNSDYVLNNINLIINTLNFGIGSTECAYTKPRGSLNLGADTSICFGQSVILGNSTTDFDSYLWSNGTTNKTIGVNTSGTFWLQVVSACDTLRDTINVNRLAGVLFTLGPDTISCIDSLVLGIGLDPSITYLWSTGETTNTITVSTSNFYWVEHSNKCNSTRDSIYVFFQQNLPPLYLGNDTILCPKESIILGSLTSPYEMFTWSTGSTNKIISVNTVGKYWLTASNICTISTDSIEIFYYPEIELNLGNDSSICLGDSITLKSNNILPNYLWSNGSTNTSITVNTGGTYWLSTQTNCGLVKDSISINISPTISQPSLGNDTLLCFGKKLKLNAKNGIQFKWSTGEVSKTILVGKGIYWLAYYNDCDTLRDSIVVSISDELLPSILLTNSELNTFENFKLISKNVKNLLSTWDLGDGTLLKGDTINYSYNKSGNYKISLLVIDSNNCTSETSIQLTVKLNEYTAPNIFTPNNDLINDEFKPIGKDIKTFNMQIFNRWGDLIFKGDNVSWKGRSSSGTRVNNGFYFYIIEVSFFNSAKATLKGEISLVR